MSHQKNVEALFGHKLRVRVCGICLQDDKILLVRHSGLGQEGILWIPPGGGMEWGQTAPENLAREFLEETGIEVEVGPFMFIHEHLKAPLHAVELFFRVYPLGGELKTGTDPELPDHQQIIQEVRYFSFQELNELKPGHLHAIFSHYRSLDELNNASGYFKFGK